MTMTDFEATIPVNGTKLHVRLEGPEAAPVVALVNSLATDLAIWDQQVPALVPHYRVLRYDVRGHGRSDAPPSPYTMDLLTDDLFALLAHFKAGPAHVVGVSLGGLIAMAAALARPTDLAGIAVCDSRADMPPEFARGIDDRNVLVREKGTQAIADMMVGRWFTPATLAAKPAYLETIRQMIRGTSVEGFTGCAAAIKLSGLRARVAQIRVPALFVVGDQDAALPVELMRAMQAEVPNARFAEIEGAGHLANVEQPERFNAALLDFLGRTAWEK
jgi:3-oxoadipate enol-lactonase